MDERVLVYQLHSGQCMYSRQRMHMCVCVRVYKARCYAQELVIGYELSFIVCLCIIIAYAFLYSWLFPVHHSWSKFIKAAAFAFGRIFCVVARWIRVVPFVDNICLKGKILECGTVECLKLIFVFFVFFLSIKIR